MSGLEVIPVVIEAAGATWQTAQKLNLAQRLMDFFKKKPDLLVLGSTGTGKTNFLKSLNASAGLVEAISAYNRTEASQDLVVRINSRPFRVWDTPGQANHQADRLAIVREALAKPPVRVLNVVSFGYHEYLDNAKAAMESGYPSEEFLAEHRERELAAVREWITILGDRNAAKWIITVVTKADLWWPHHNAVLDHYAAGSYADLIKSVDPSIQHAVLPYCSVFHRFYGQARLPGDFDDEQRMATNLHFLDQLVRLG